QLALADRRVRKHGRDQRDEAHRDAQLVDGVTLVAEIVVGLDRRRLLHHALTHGPDLQHVRAHDLVAALRHPLDLVDAAQRLDAEAEEYDPEGVADGEDLAHVFGQLLVGAVHALALLAAQLELPSGLDRDVRLPAIERDDTATVEFRLPAVAL